MDRDRIDELLIEIEEAIELADACAPNLPPGKDIFSVVREAFRDMKFSLETAPEHCDLDFIREAVGLFRGKLIPSTPKTMSVEDLLEKLRSDDDLPEAS